MMKNTLTKKTNRRVFVNMLVFIFVFSSIASHLAFGADVRTIVSTKPSLITPYVNSADISGIPGGYSSDENISPWHIKHLGIDFNPKKSSVPFQAAAAGVVDGVNLFKNGINGKWQVNVGIKINSNYTISYAFEMPTSSELEGKKQLKNVFVKKGQKIKQGSLVGNLIGTHVDFGLSDNKKNIRISPEPFFTAKAKASILSIIHKEHPYWGITYSKNNSLELLDENNAGFQIGKPYKNVNELNSVNLNNFGTFTFKSSGNAGSSGSSENGGNAVISATSGEVYFIRKQIRQEDGNWSVSVSVKINSFYYVEYEFLTDSKDSAEADKQIKSITVKVGNKISVGQEIGKLLPSNNPTSLILSVVKVWGKISPVKFFSSDLSNEIKTVSGGNLTNSNGNGGNSGENGSSGNGEEVVTMDVWHADLKLEIGDYSLLEAFKNDKKLLNVKWVSDDTSIATVGSDGWVKAIKAGNVKIRGTSENGEYTGVSRVIVSEIGWRPQLITPYVNSADIEGINEAYSISSNCPWGFQHVGVDFFPKETLAPFRAAESGTVENLGLNIDDPNDTTNGRNVGLAIKINDTYTIGYNFETFSKKNEDGLLQLSRILVTNGQKVQKGDIIGYLVLGGNGAHIDFGFYKNGDRISPELYFTDEARTSVLDLIHKNHQDWNMTYDKRTEETR